MTALVLILFPIFIIFVLPRVIIIKKIDCESQYGPCSDAVISKLASWRGKNMGEAEKQIKNYLAKNPLVSSFSVQYNLTDRLKVRIVVRKPQFAIKKDGADSIFLVDKDGYVIDTVNASGLPLLSIPGDIPTVGSVIDSEDLFALRILYGMFSLSGAKTAKVENETLSIGLPNGLTIIFPLSGDADVLLGEANLILSRLNKSSDISKIGGVSTIDLRFKNPILQ